MSPVFQVEENGVVRREDLSGIGPQWEFNWDRATVLVHDMQNYFVRTLPNETRDNITSSVKEVVGTAIREGTPIVYSGQSGDMKPEDRGLMSDFWGLGMSSHLEDTSLLKEVTHSRDSPDIYKTGYSAFSRTSLLNRIIESGNTQILICGIYTHVGILATALDAFNYGIKAFIIGDASASFNRYMQIKSLNYINDCCGKIIFKDELVRKQA